MNVPVRVLIADDHALFRQGLKSMLKLQADVDVVGEVARTAELPQAVRETPCDILLLDLEMERSSLPEIEALGGRVKIIVVTASERLQDAVDALQAGARGVIFKRFAIQTLMESIHAVMDGDVWVPPAVQRELTARLREPATATLTSREREIVRHVALGLRNAEIGRRLFISEVTVKSHLNNVFQKLAVRDRVELALYAVRTGIIGVHERAS